MANKTGLSSSLPCSIMRVSSQNLFQNDFNYVFSDFSCPINSPQSELKRLLSKHEHDSTSAPYFLIDQMRTLQTHLPYGWQVLIDNTHLISPDKIRITIFNLYQSANVSINFTDRAIKLTAIPVGGDFIVVKPFTEEYEQILELNSAHGESIIQILITPGSSFNAAPLTVSAAEIEVATEYLKSLNVS